MKNKAIATIPFQGFYDSIYSYSIEGEIENTAEWYSEDYMDTWKRMLASFTIM